MTVPPWLLLVVVGSLAIALLYQIVTRRFGWRVVAYWILISVGVLGAEALAESLSWEFSRVGDLRLVPDLLGGGVIVAALWFLGI